MIPFFSSDLSHPNYRDALNLALFSGHAGPGPRCEELAERLGPRCVLTTSGTQALALAAAAFQVDEVIVPAYCVAAVPNAFRVAYPGELRLNDVSELGAMCADYRGLRRIDSATRPALCFVNHGGRRDGLSVHRAWADHEGWPLIEDASCSIGEAAPALGDATVYSFSGPKLVTGGQGGAVVFKHQTAYDWARRYVDHGAGFRDQNLVHSPGTNLRMSDLTAALILAQLKRLDELRAHQVEVSAAYHTFASPHVLDLGLHKVCLTPRAPQLKAFLAASDVEASWPQYRGVWEHPLYAHLGDAERFPNAARWSREAVYLPFGPGLRPEDAARVARLVREFSDVS